MWEGYEVRCARVTEHSAAFSTVVAALRERELRVAAPALPGSRILWTGW